jgi:hypothetical protein
MKMIAIVVVAVAMSACDDDNHHSKSGDTRIAFSPTPAVAAQIFPQTLPVFGVTSTCAPGSVFSPGFDLVIVQTGLVNLFMDQVTLRLIDGTGLGTPITFPRSQLNSMFGSTLVVGTRAFKFLPQFNCGLTRPGSISAEVDLIDGTGMARTVSVNAALK